MTSSRAGRLSIPIAAAGIAFLLHLAGNPHYGFFRDELYFIVCGQHPQWGYVDQPPVAPLLAAGSQIFGHSLVLLRAVPAFFAAGGVYVTCELAVEFGGAAFAQILAAMTAFFAPVLMNFGMKVSPDMVGLWLWPLLTLYVVRLAGGADPRWWLAAGAILGICVQSKYTVVFFAVSLLAGLLLTRERRILFSRWALAGGLVCALIALPNFLWQAHYGFPQLELLRNAQQGKNVVVGPLTYLFQQFLITGVLLACVWIAGLAWLFAKPRLRFLAYTFLALMAMMIFAHAKHYYPADVYPYLMAAGGVAIEAWTRGRRIIRTAVATAVLLFGILLVPAGMPVLAEEQMVSYTNMLMRALRLRRNALATENKPQTELSSDFADMHGWPELASTVARVYQSLPPEERAQAAIFANNYGEAAAIDFFGRQYGLPPAISGHNQYYLWGTHGYTGNVLIRVGRGSLDARLFDNYTQAASFTSPWIQAYEDHLPIIICRGIKKPLAEVWPRVKAYK
ncbi:MAG: ArnT family glycosyltransferase [Bryobacteraceae bacterium]